MAPASDRPNSDKKFATRSDLSDGTRHVSFSDNTGRIDQTRRCIGPGRRDIATRAPIAQRLHTRS